jgi:hypothetical protein
MPVPQSLVNGIFTFSTVNLTPDYPPLSKLILVQRNGNEEYM